MGKITFSTALLNILTEMILVNGHSSGPDHSGHSNFGHDHVETIEDE